MSFAEPAALQRDFLAGSQRALARAISWAESGRVASLIAELYPRTGRALTIGLTGPPGVGKSTLTSALVRTARGEGKTVGVISVDPSSPFTHGAVLGDRIRLTEHFTDDDVFIRSMASRGHLGGLAGATGDAILLMDAFGKDVVIVETVGVGQSEVEIAELADTTLVAMQPGSGDSVQILKAGILEVADVFIVNKADHPMAKALQRDIRTMLEMQFRHEGWNPQIVATQAVEGVGIPELWGAIHEHRAYLEQSGDLHKKRARAFEHRVRELALGKVAQHIEVHLNAQMRRRSEAHEERTVDPYAAADRVIAALGLDGGRQP